MLLQILEIINIQRLSGRLRKNMGRNETAFNIDVAYVGVVNIENLNMN